MYRYLLSISNIRLVERGICVESLSAPITAKRLDTFAAFRASIGQNLPINPCNFIDFKAAFESYIRKENIAMGEALYILIG